MPESTGIDIRRAGLDDLDTLVPLFDAYRQFYRREPDLALARAFLRDRLERSESIIFLALADGAAGGFTQLFPSFSCSSAARIYILNDLYVAPEARRRGIGAALLAKAAEFAASEGAIRLKLSTEHTNTTAQALYESQGWIREPNFRDYTLAIAPYKLSQR